MFVTAKKINIAIFYYYLIEVIKKDNDKEI